MVVEWYYEDKVGDRVEVEQVPQYAEQKRHRMFVLFVNIFYHAVEGKSMTVPEIVKVFKNVRKEWIDGVGSDSLRSCGCENFVLDNDVFIIFCQCYMRH